MPKKVKDMKYIKVVKPGTYRISIRRGIDLNGKNLFYTKQISDTTDTKAMALRDEMLDEVKELRKYDGTIKVRAFANRWMTEYVNYKDEGTTIDDKWSKLNNHILPYIGDYAMEDVSSRIIQQLINLLTKKDSQKHDKDGNVVKLSPTTVKNVYNVLCAMFTYASSGNNKIIKESPCSDIILPKREDYKPEIFTPDEMEVVISLLYNDKYITIQRRTQYLLAMCVGLRRGEIAGLRWEDIDFENQTIYVTKSLSKSKAKGEELKNPKSKHGIRPVGVNALVFKHLKEQQLNQQRLKDMFGKQWIDTPTVFNNEMGGYPSKDAITSSWADFVARNNLKHVKLHGLRASFASYLSSKGIYGKELAALMGHSRSITTEKYYIVVYPDSYKKIIKYTNEIGKNHLN